MRKIVAIGGGSMVEGATAAIDAEIIKFSGKKTPTALFIPTASGDNLDYCKNFRRVYSEKFGCRTDSLLLLKGKPPVKTIREKIFNADIIYVGGGNTLMMMRRWRLLGVDKLLIQTCQQGKVMAGVSAGAICWFQFGHSDSEFYYHPENWDWIRVRGLGILPFTACPHYLKEHRDKHFQNMIKNKGGIGLALDDCSAIQVLGNQFRILHSNKEARAFRVYRKKGAVRNELLPASPQFQSLKSLENI